MQCLGISRIISGIDAPLQFSISLLLKTNRLRVQSGDPSVRTRVVQSSLSHMQRYSKHRDYAYKKAATMAPKPRTLPAAALTLAAAP